jgi:hypothetical protein
MVATVLSRQYIELDGLGLTASYDDGSQILMETFEGWGSPASTINPQQKPRANGVWAGDAFLGERPMSMNGTITAPSIEVAEAAKDRLIAAVSLSAVPMIVTQGTLVRSLMVRRSGAVIVNDIGDDGTSLEWSIQIIATDPRKTAAVALTGTTGLPMSSGGLTVPFTVPFAIASTVVSGQVNLTNPGNIAGKVVLRIDGPVTAPVVTHVSSGKSIVFSASLTIPAGNYVLIDMESHQVLENGTASRNGWVTGRGWSSFQPGDNTWAFSAAAHNTGTLTVTAMPSWS